MIGWQLPAVASGLSGGATVSGFGAFVAGVASRRLVAAIGQAFTRGGNDPRSGGRIRDRTGPGDGGTGAGDGALPAYQRAARDNLGQGN
ncbi:conjugal transfer protein TraH, partial [Paraburkholderia sediminicola]